MWQGRFEASRFSGSDPEPPRGFHPRIRWMPTVFLSNQAWPSCAGLYCKQSLFLTAMTPLEFEAATAGAGVVPLRPGKPEL